MVAHGGSKLVFLIFFDSQWWGKPS
jgi:hypothetical protein